MRRIGRIVGVLCVVEALALLGCAHDRDRPVQTRQLMTPTSRLIYHGGAQGYGVYTFCDRQNRIYMAEAGELFQVVPYGCLDNQP